jgi:hypothetical protein
MAKSQPIYEVDRAASKQRAKRLQSYLTKHVWDPSTRRAWADFKCESKTDCKTSALKRGASFHAAQGHAVGDCYDLQMPGGVDFRVLIVPMEAGGGKTYFGVEGRTEKVRESSRLPFPKRNAHMKGVTLALRLALGLPYMGPGGAPLIDHETERVNFSDGTDAHLFDCFAMANLLLCSAVLKKGSQKSLATPVMRQNCVDHLVRTIGVLEPTLVISQGWGELKNTLLEKFSIDRRFRQDLADCYLADCHLNGHPFVWVALWHPTRFWSSIKQQYFEDTVVPAIGAARKRALKMVHTG